MNTIRWMSQSGAWRQARWLVLAVVLSLTAVSPAWAKGKKIEEEAAATKSYTVPYMIVMTLMGLGLMTVLFARQAAGKSRGPVGQRRGRVAHPARQ